MDTTTTHYSSPFLYVHIGFWILRIAIRPNCNNYNITIVPTTSHLSQTKRISSSLLPLSVRKFNITARPKDRIISIWMQVSSCGASARRHMENLYLNRTKFEIWLVNTDHVETSGCWEIRFVWASINICWYSNTKAVAYSKADKYFSCYPFLSFWGRWFVFIKQIRKQPFTEVLQNKCS